MERMRVPGSFSRAVGALLQDDSFGMGQRTRPLFCISPDVWNQGQNQGQPQRQWTGVFVPEGRRCAPLTGEAAVSTWVVSVHADSRLLARLRLRRNEQGLVT